VQVQLTKKKKASELLGNKWLGGFLFSWGQFPFHASGRLFVQLEETTFQQMLLDIEDDKHNLQTWAANWQAFHNQQARHVVF